MPESAVLELTATEASETDWEAMAAATIRGSEESPGWTDCWTTCQAPCCADCQSCSCI